MKTILAIALVCAPCLARAAEVVDVTVARDDHAQIDLSIEPFSVTLGSAGAALAYAPTRHLAIRLSGRIYDLGEGDDDHGYQLDLTVPIFAGEAFKGIFLEPGFMYLDPRDATNPVYGPELLLGFQARAPIGLTLTVAAGGGLNLNRDLEGGAPDTWEPERTFTAGYVRVGYAF
jgi:hypothetical protein